MATNLRLLVLMALLSLVSSVDIPPGIQNEDLVIAASEMQRANYFTFVLLLNMAKLDRRLQGNITFLMPNDRMLSKIALEPHAISDFLLRHSIPSTMLFDYLHHIPTGSSIPSSKRDYMLKISNNGASGLNMTPAAGPSVSPPKSGSSTISIFSVTYMLLSLWISSLCIVL
uniref:FAS1 domain-containing protein n=1 Tax=Cannabis sativa TaxID=3483 RepID=A0A803PLE6_CANSA